MSVLKQAALAGCSAIRNFSTVSFLTLVLCSLLSSSVLAATLTGSVMDADDGVIAVHPVAIDLMDITTGASLHSVMNLPDGSYEITDINPGDYILFFNAVDAANGYIDELFDDITPCSNGGCDMVTLSTHLSVADGANVQDEDLVPGALINGTVTVTGSGTPLEGVNIEFFDGAGNYVHGEQTQSDGSYSSGGLPSQPLYVVANGTAIGYQTEIYDDVLCPNEDCISVAGSATQANPGAGSTAVADFDLGEFDPGNTLTGTVMDAADGVTPVHPVIIDLMDTNTGESLHSVSNLEDGSYEITGITPGDYIMFFNAVDAANGYIDELYDDITPCDNGGCDMLTLGTFLNVVEGSNVHDEELEMGSVQGVAGNITGLDTLLPLEGIILRVFDLQCNFQGGAETDVNGDYEVSLGGAGDYYLFAVANDSLFTGLQTPYINEQYPDIQVLDTCYPFVNDLSLGEVVTVGADEMVSGKDFVLEPGGEILGTISDINGVLPNGAGTARLFIPDGKQQILAFNNEPDGSYRLGGVLPGTYQMVLTTRGMGLIDERYDDVACPRNSCDSVLGTELTITGTESFTGIDAVLGSGAVIRGTITDADSALPIEGYCAYFYNSAGVYSTVACTDENGDYETTAGLPDGTYYLSNQFYLVDYQDVRGGYVPQVWTNDGSFLACGTECDFLLGDTVTVNGLTPVEGIDMAMLLNQASLSGTIVDASDGVTPVHPVAIDLFGTDGSYLDISTTNNPDGSYELTDVTPGQYMVLFNAVDAAETYADELYDEVVCSNGSCPISAVGTPVDITLGSNTLDEDLSPGGGISGVISSSATGQPLGQSEGRARLYQTDGTQVTTTLTDENGAYNFGGVPAGDYFVILAPRFSNLIDELYNDIPCPRLSCNTGGGTVITVSNGSTVTGVDATLDPGSQITGSVVVDGELATGGTILLYNDAGIYAGFGIIFEDGSYITGSGLPADDYYVTLEVDGFVNTVYPNRPCGDPCDPTLGEVVTVDGVNDLTGIDFNTSSGNSDSAVIFGTVIADVGGAPLNDIKICAVSQGDDSIENCAVTDAQGSYLIGSLPALNDYSVFTREVGGQAFFGEVYDSLDCCDASAGTPVDISGGSVQIDFGLASSGRIAGKITDSVSGDGVTHVAIMVLDEFSNQINTIETETSDDPASLGQFAVSGLPDGIFYLYAQGEWQGYANELYPDIKRFSQYSQDPVTDGQAIVIQNGTLVDGINLALDPAGSISGTISDANGILPGNEARIRLYNQGSRETLIQSGNWNEDQTYTLSGMPPGTYDVLLTSRNSDLIGERYDGVHCPRNSCDLSLGTAVVVGPQEHVTGIDATLESGSRVLGQVSDAQSVQGVGGFCVGIYTESGVYAAFACTDSEGDFLSSTGLPAGNYRVANQIFSNEIVGGYLPQVWTDDGSFVNCGVPCDVLAGDTFALDGVSSSQAINIAMEQGSTISGNVQFGGSTLIGTDVVLLDDRGLDIKSIQTDGAGNYIFDGLGSGDYYVRTLNNQGYQDRLHNEPTDIVCNPDCNPFSASRIVLGASSTVGGIDFTLTEAGSISGTITDGSAPLSGVTVEAYNVLGDLVASSLSGPDGSYLIGGLGNGDHYVRTRNQLGYRNGLFDTLPCPANCRVLNGSAVTVSSGVSTSNVDFILDNGSTISGNVQGEGDPDAVSLPGTEVLIYAESGVLAASVFADGNGGYRADGLEAGNYQIVTRTVSPYHVDQSADGTACQANCDPLSTTVVPLGVSEDLVQDFLLDIGATLSMYIYSYTNFEVDQITLIVTDDSGQEIKRAVSAGAADTLANLTITGLAKTDVFLYTENEVGYRDEVYGGPDCPAPCDPTMYGRKVDLSQNVGLLEMVMFPALTIEGHVIDPGTLEPSPYVGLIAYLYDQNGTQLKVTYPNESDGSFRFSGYPNGSYRLLIKPYQGYYQSPFRNYVPGEYVGQVYGGNTCTPNPCDINSGTEIVLNGSDVDGISIELVKGNYIQGNAFDVDGNQIREGVVRLYSATGEYLENTSIGGQFQFSGIADGTYFLGFQATNSDLIDTVYQDLQCPGMSCDVTGGAAIALPGGVAPGAQRVVLAGGSGEGAADPVTVSVTIEPERGYLINGSMKDANNDAVKFTKVHFFTQNGSYAGEAITDGFGNFTSEGGLPDGTYFAATNRAGRVEDTASEASAAVVGVSVLGLANQIYSSDVCDGVCAPSLVSGIGTPIVISGANREGVDFVLVRAPGISIEKQTNGEDADTANGGEAPAIAIGETVSWTYEVTNTGGEVLVNIVVVDDQGVAVSCPSATLASDASMTCTGSEPAADLSLDPFDGVMGNCEGTPDSRLYQNTGTVTAETNGGTDVDDSDTSHYCNPVIKDDLIFSNSFE